MQETTASEADCCTLSSKAVGKVSINFTLKQIVLLGKDMPTPENILGCIEMCWIKMQSN